MRKILAIALMATLAACNADRAPGGDASRQPAAADQPTGNVPPATASKDVDPTGTGALSRFDGYGGLRFGQSEADMEKSWGGELARLGTASDACHFMTPEWVKVPEEFAFMIEGGKFVRYDSRSDKVVAPGGGKLGMDTAQIMKLYAGRVDVQPHKYVEGGKILRIKDTAGNSALVFEMDAKGRVDRWRVGVPPQVDYVEGCS